MRPPEAKSPSQGRATGRDSRRHLRTPCKEDTHFLFRQRLYEGTITNMSQSGAYIATEGLFLVGQEVTVAGPFEADGGEGKRQGAIVRRDAGGIGVKFK